MIITDFFMIFQLFIPKLSYLRSNKTTKGSVMKGLTQKQILQILPQFHNIHDEMLS